MFALGFATGREVAHILVADATGDVVAVGRTVDGETSITPYAGLAAHEALAAEYAAGREAVTIERYDGELELMTGDPRAVAGAATILRVYYRTTAERIEMSMLVDEYPRFDFAQLIDGFAAAIEAAAPPIAYGVLSPPDVQLIMSDRPLRLFEAVVEEDAGDAPAVIRDLLDQGPTILSLHEGAAGLLLPPAVTARGGEIELRLDGPNIALGEHALSAMMTIDDAALVCVIPWAAIRAAWLDVPDPELVAFKETR